MELQQVRHTMFSSRAVTSTNVNTTIDPYFKNTIFLLHADGTNGATNTTYKDNSNYNAVVSRGALFNSQGSFSPYSPAGWSMYFNGSTDYLSFPITAAGTISTGDFTAECWTWVTTAFGTNAVFFTIGALNATGSFSVFVNAGSTYVRIGASNDTVINAVPAQNTWTHFAVVRISGVFTVYFNGVSQTKASSLNPGTAITGTASSLAFDAIAAGVAYWPGYISNFRIVVGTGVYTGNFTTPTSPLANTQSAGSNISAISSGTAFLLNLNRWYDASGNDYQVTVGGNATIIPFTPFSSGEAYTPSLHGGSIYHASATDWVGTTTAVIATALTWPQLGLGGEDFTIEFWAYPLTATSATQYFFSNFSADTNQRGMRIGVTSAASTPGAYVLYSTGALAPGFNASAVRPLYAFSWSHIAVSRRQNTSRVFQNGQMVYEFTDTTVYNLPTFTIGNNTYARTGAVIGYTCDLRITRGTTAYFESNFLVPQAALQTLELPNSQLYIGQFTGSTTYWSYDLGQFPNTTTGFFCIEFWINFTTVPVAGTTIFGGASGNGMSLVIASTSSMFLSNNGVYNLTNTTQYNFQAGVWYHIAWMGGNSTNYLAVDGSVYNFNQKGGFGSSAATANGIWLNDYTIGATGLAAYYRDIRVTYNSMVYDVNGFTRPTGPLSATVAGGTVKMLVLNNAGSADVVGQVTTTISTTISGIDTTNVTVSAGQGGVGARLYPNAVETVLLLNGSNGNLIDATGRNNITYGAAGGAVIPSINTTNKKFGTGGVGLMAAGFMRIPNSPLWDFGSGNFVIEYWYYPTNVTTLQTIYSKKAAAAGFGPIQTNISTTGKVTTLISTSGAATTQTLLSVASVVISTWNYIAIFRNGGSITQHVILASGSVDTQTNATLSTTALASNTADFTIGNQSNAASQPMLGYVDEFRVTKGTNRGYTSSSLPTAPTTAFPNL